MDFAGGLDWKLHCLAKATNPLQLALEPSDIMEYFEFSMDKIPVSLIRVNIKRVTTISLTVYN